MSSQRYGVLSADARLHSAIEQHVEFAAKIGAIIATFAFIERDMPMVVSRLTTMSTRDAFAVIGVFRAFSNRIDILSELIKSHAEKSVEREVGSYFKGRFTEANKLRNRYAHASYAGE